VYELAMKIQRPFGRTLIMTAVILVLYFFVGEAVARSDRFQAKFAGPTWGSRHAHFERQLDHLNHFVNHVGPVDCLFLGSSMVISDIDPLSFANAYQNESGEAIRCFNFGVDGLSALGAAALAKILVADYQPRLLVYGTDARDYAVEPEAEDATAILDTPWIRYRLGEFSIMGWLLDTSSLLRYRRPLRTLLRLNLPLVVLEYDRRESHTGVWLGRLQSFERRRRPNLQRMACQGNRQGNRRGEMNSPELGRECILAL
jgi:hypothetical protein